ncbi:MAG: hypothetical protein ACREWE_04940 [Gammaproteobacteria bacterium]
MTLGDAKPPVLKAPIQVLESPGRQLALVAAAVVLVTVILGLLQRRRLPFGRRGIKVVPERVNAGKTRAFTARETR